MLVEKHYAGYQTRAVVETFLAELAKHTNPLDLPPVIATPKNFIFHIRAGELIFLATHKKVRAFFIAFKGLRAARRSR